MKFETFKISELIDEISMGPFGSNITILSVFFPKVNETKKLGLIVAIGNGLMTLESEEATQKIKSFVPILNNESKIPTDLVRAIEELQPYLEYLD